MLLRLSCCGGVTDAAVVLLLLCCACYICTCDVSRSRLLLYERSAVGISIDHAQHAKIVFYVASIAVKVIFVPGSIISSMLLVAVEMFVLNRS